MYYAFSEPFPIRHTALNRSSALNVLSTTCCASRTSRASSASTAQTPKKKRARPKARVSQTQNQTHEPTVTELAAQISQTIGLHIIRSDLDNLYSFLRSFVKVKTIYHNEHLSNQPSNDTKPLEESGHDSESSVEDTIIQQTVPSDGVNNSFAPKSMLGRAVASNYVAMRGSLDRTMESISLATQSLLLSMIATAGSTMFSILEAGQKAFPALDFSSAKLATQQMIEHGWNPLKSFQWQVAAMSDAQKLSESRRERVEYVKEYLRGKSGGPWTQSLRFVSESVSTTFSVFENVTPVLIQGTSRLASVGYGGLKAIGHWGAMRSEAHELTKNGPNALRSIQARVAFLDKLPPLSSSSAKTTFRRGEAPLASSKDSLLGKNKRSENMELSSLLPNGLRRIKHGVSEVKSSKSSKGQNVEVIEARKPNDMLEKGGAVLGAGMLLMATSGISLPAAITCSALVITTVGVAQAKAAVNENEIHQEASAAFRQSRSVRKLEKVILLKRQAPKRKNFTNDHKPVLEFSHAKQAVSAPAYSEARVGHNFKELEARVEDTFAIDVDVKTYSVSQSEPSILSVPVLGTILNTTDDMAFRIEAISGLVFSRLETILGIRQDSTTWVLLKSFQRNSDISKATKFGDTL